MTIYINAKRIRFNIIESSLIKNARFLSLRDFKKSKISRISKKNDRNLNREL